MFDRFKKPTPGEGPERAQDASEPRPAPGGFGRRQTPVGGSAALEPPPSSAAPSGGFGRRPTPPAGAAPSAAPQQPAGNELKKISQAGGKIAQFLMQAYRDGRGVHVETIVAAAAALAGEFALRASAPRLPDSGWIAGAPADALIFGGFPDKRVTMWGVVHTVLVGSGADNSKLPNMNLIATRASSLIGKEFPPKLSVPLQHFPHEFSPNAAPRFRNDVAAIAREFGLDPTETALALAFTLAMLIKNAHGIVPVDILAMLAAEIMVAMTRMAPLKAPIQIP
jgi:hypothetical protein